ncbi:QcrA and Rieske domain-containing protein [Mangrovibacterium lignilyticum]|uniref:QcrA and Rieske domain-containing protein n=1 Tax=Mangrovibacterium lignilyticum TaxID=2668052 RepID=UPI0019675B4E|nr:Rieske (2Fe-2S) protein [Mangrovibacterium lignilyticum]
MERVSRRTFLQLAMTITAGLFVALWNKLAQNQLKQDEQRTRIFPFNKNKTVIFADNFIIINQEDSTTVLSAHCTHLGCKINETENGKLICPCHGSEYDLSGNVLKGPAYKSLPQLQARISDDGNQIEIQG